MKEPNPHRAIIGSEGAGNVAPNATPPSLPLRELDLRVAAVELAQAVEETERLIAGLDEARLVRRKVLDLEISI